MVSGCSSVLRSEVRARPESPIQAPPVPPSHRGNTPAPDRALQRRGRIPSSVSGAPTRTVWATENVHIFDPPYPLRLGSCERRGCPPQPRRSYNFMTCPDGRGGQPWRWLASLPGRRISRAVRLNRTARCCSRRSRGAVWCPLPGHPPHEPSVSVGTRRNTAATATAQGHCGPIAATWRPTQRRCSSPRW